MSVLMIKINELINEYYN